MEKNSHRGKVKFFNETKGFGFSKEESGDEHFVHISGVVNGESLNAEDEVSFDLAEGKKGLNAVNVSLI